MLGLSFILTCCVCRRPWVSDAERWRAYHVGEDFTQPAELVFYCPGCAKSDLHLSPAGFVVLNGRVTDGSFQGAEVHRRSDLVGATEASPSGPESSRLMPATA